MNISISEADDIQVIRNLIVLYIYDLSEIMGWDCPDNGLFGGCDELPQYWGQPPDNSNYAWPKNWKGYPFLIRVDGKLAGFALVRQLGSERSYDIGEFFILRKYRNRGIGRYVAYSLFDRFPGSWQVAQMVGNTPAQAFWRNVIGDYTSGDYADSEGIDDVHGMKLTIQSFSNTGL